MTYYLAETAGHKLRTLTHERDLPVVIKLTCGSVAGAVAQTGDSSPVPPLLLLELSLLILKPVLRKIESTPALLNQVIVILRALSICQNWQNWTSQLANEMGFFQRVC